MATTALRPRERDALLQSLRAGVKNLAIRTQPEGGAMTTAVEKFTLPARPRKRHPLKANAIRWLGDESAAKTDASHKLPVLTL